MKHGLVILAGCVGLAGIVPAASATTVDFSDVSLAPGAYDNGGPVTASGSFVSGGASFNNSFTDFGGGYSTWAGWSLSAVNDSTTAGYENQYASAAGGGTGGVADVYAVGYATDYDLAWINLPAGEALVSAEIVNTTYAALTMRDGDAYGFSKKFGGASGTDPDYFTATFTGYSGADASGGTTGSVTVYLADFRSSNSAEDYILTDWTAVDLSPLGNAASLSLSFTSSDVGSFGINTPTYVALDNLTFVPEPAMAGLLGIGLMIMIRRQRA